MHLTVTKNRGKVSVHQNNKGHFKNSKVCSFVGWQSTLHRSNTKTQNVRWQEVVLRASDCQGNKCIASGLEALAAAGAHILFRRRDFLKTWKRRTCALSLHRLQPKASSSEGARLSDFLLVFCCCSTTQLQQHVDSSKYNKINAAASMINSLFQLLENHVETCRFSLFDITWNFILELCGHFLLNRLSVDQ